MAAGDFVVDESSLSGSGNQFVVSGTAEIDGTARAFDIFPKGFVIPGTFKVNGYDDAGAVEVRENETAAGVADNGSVAMQSSTRGVNTYRWTCSYIV